jgi:hypothetical protein
LDSFADDLRCGNILGLGEFRQGFDLFRVQPDGIKAF